MNEKVATIIAWLDEQIGCPYIYGATGQACTPQYRRARMDQYPEYADKIKRNCPRMNGGAASCAGCKWAEDGTGRLAYDCAQLTRRAMEQAGIALVSGANSQWQKTAFVAKGNIDEMPANLLCLVYRDDGGRKGHTGVYTGDLWAVHAKGHDYGVVREPLANTKFTHFGIPAGLYSDEELIAAGIDPSGNVLTLRRGSKGELVKRLQRTLNFLLDEHLTVDGVFGAKTEAAVKVLQSKLGLTADGIVGPKTWAALGMDFNDPEPEPEEPGTVPEEPETGLDNPDEEEPHPPDMMSVSRADLEAWADVLEKMARDIQEILRQG